MNGRNPRNFVPVAVAGLLVAALATLGLLDGPPGSAMAVASAKRLGAQTENRSPGKPRPPVEVSLLPASQLEAGVPARLALRVRSAEQIEVMELAVEGDAGLTVVSARREVPGTADIRYQSVGEAARFEISAVPMSGGTRHLSGLVRFTVNGVAQTAPFRLRIEVAGPVTVPATASEKPVREPWRDATGEVIDSMPAETIVR